MGDLGCHDFFAQLETGYAVMQQPAGFRLFFVDHHRVPVAGQLFCDGHAGRTAADHRLLPAITQKDRLKVFDPFMGWLLRRRAGWNTNSLPTD